MPAKRNKKRNNISKEKSGNLQINRRTFIGITAAVGATTAASHVIKRPGVALARPPQQSTGGVITEEWISTSCLSAFSCWITSIV
jgi:hypothetical protein